MSWAFQQIGQEINGTVTSDISQDYGSISGDGTTISLGFERLSNIQGRVRVYRLINGVWTQIGNTLGENLNLTNSSLFTINKLNHDGTILAVSARSADQQTPFLNNVGRVFVFKYDGTNWNLMGQSIDGTTAEGSLGATLDLSNDGQVVAVSQFQGSSNNRVLVYKYNTINNSWEQYGNILSNSLNSLFGSCISLSNNGKTIAIGVSSLDIPTNTVNFYNQGAVEVYEIIDDANPQWILKGSQFFKNELGLSLGFSVDLNVDGSILAISGRGSDASNNHVDIALNYGMAEVYKFSNTTSSWTKIGQTIYGQNVNDRLGRLSISSDGTILLIGVENFDGSGTDIGYVLMYKYDSINNIWNLLSSPIVGDATNDRFGSFINMNSDGTRFTVIAPGSDTNIDNNNNVGSMKVFQTYSFSINTKPFGTAPFKISSPSTWGNYTSTFTYTSSNTNVATINNDIVTIVGLGTTMVTATQLHTGLTLSATFEVLESSAVFPVELSSADDIIYFVLTSSDYGKITNKTQILNDLLLSLGINITDQTQNLNDLLLSLGININNFV